MRPAHLARYKDIARLLVAHRRLVGLAGTPGGEGPTDPAASDEATVAADAEALAADLEALGPTFVKLGQLLSTRADLLPRPYLDALARLQDDVEPFPFAEVERIVSAELGVRLSKGFASFDEVPLAAASLGQVHRAQLRDGRLVVVKVQRPDLRDRIVDDMDAVEEIAALADRHTEAGRRMGFGDMVDELRRSLLDELDYRREAANLVALREDLADHERIVVPAPVPDYSTERVLTMDYVAGTGVAALGGVRRTELDGPALAQALFEAYLDQILLHGRFHADPHPGNVLVTDDGRLALLDLGMVGHVDPAIQDRLLKLLMAVGEGRGRDAADVAIDLGRELEGFDAEEFRRRASQLVERHRSLALGDLQAGALVADLTQTAAASGLRLPPELTLLGKALLNLDEVARTLDPTFDPTATIERRVAEIMGDKLRGAVSPAGAVAAAMEAKQFAEQFPGRVNQVMDALAAGQLTLNIQGVDEADIMRSVQKLANRVTAGLVVASLVVGAALIMQIETETELFGYPALAIVLFLVAAAAGLWLVVSSLLNDLPQKHRRRHR